tara:strand:+ start:410 stop:1066 length:657 start_codon:yes stop_codon:yes gene_type:complete
MGIEVKICGITNKGDAINSLQAGADYLGFILYPQSPRSINLENVNQISECLQDTPGKTVAVDVVPNLADVVLMQQAEFQFYQFHFPLDLEKETILRWSELVGPANLWLAPKLPPGARFPDFLLEYAETFVIDAYSKNKFGGTGTSADLESFAKYQSLFPEKNWILAGGLGPKNVVSSVLKTNARTVDLNSAVEQSPGQKDFGKIKSVFEALRRESLTE